MKGGKLFQLLQALSVEEWKALKKMVASPVYNTNPTLSRLLFLLQRQLPHFDDSGPGKAKLFAQLWPGRAYDNYKLHRLFSQMTQLVEDYLLLVAQRADPFERQKRLQKIYSQRHLTVFFNSASQELEKKLAQSSSRGQEYYQQQIELNEAIYFHPQKNKYDLKDQSLDRLMDSLDHYFALAKLRYGLSLKNREHILQKPAQLRLLDSLRDEPGLSQLRETILYQLYEKAFLLLEEGAPHFPTYEQLLFGHINQLGYDSKILFFNGLNFINRQVNRGFSAFSQIALNWYRFGLQNELLMENGKMNEVTFGNIVVFGCREQHFAWTKEFIDTYQDWLDPTRRNDIVVYHRSIWHFYQRNYETAYSTLINYPFIPAYFLKSRLTAIRAIFEHFLLDRQYYDILTHQIHAFEMAIRRRQTFSKAAKTPILNCILMLRTLAKKIWNHQFNAAEKEKFRAILISDKKIATKAWLLEKINNL